ncbi:MAG: hypothetical protein QOD35_3223 [Nocardioidaceae bacterium]|nr:hypothetical protein [Nocardioidaceae bacterium]
MKHPPSRRRLRSVALLGALSLVGLATMQSALSANAVSARGHVPAVGKYEIRPHEPVESSPKKLLSASKTSGTKGALSAPVASGLPVRGATGVRTRINGLSLMDQRLSNNGNSFSLEPPDQALCTGNGYVLEGVNNVFSIYSTSGAKLSGNQSYDPFWNHGVAEATRKPDGTIVRYGPFISDPRCYYDPQLKRFFMTELQLGTKPSTGDFTGTSAIRIAVSKSSKPSTDASDWHLYSINTRNDGTQGTPSGHTGCPCFGDQPLIGADKYGFYITTNEFPIFKSGFNGAQMYAMDKAALAKGHLKLQRIEANNPPLDEGVAYSVQPATSPTASDWSTAANGTEYFMSAFDFAATEGTATFDNRIATWAMTNTRSLTTGTPDVRVSNTTLHSEVYGQPPVARQKDGPTPLGDALKEKENRLDTNDDRMQQVVYADGKLWSGLNTAVKNTEARPAHAGIAYFVVSPHASASGVTASIAHQGYVAVAGNQVMYPAIGVAPGGSATMVFTLAGQDYFPSAADIHLARSGALSSSVQLVKAGTKPADGFTGYKAEGGDGVERWGDYSAAVGTPDGSVWIATEYIPGTFGYPDFVANWGTYVAQVAP